MWICVYIDGEFVQYLLGPFWESVGIGEFSQTPFKCIKHLSGMLKMGAAAGVENKFSRFFFKRSHSAFILNMLWRLMYLAELEIQ